MSPEFSYNSRLTHTSLNQLTSRPSMMQQQTVSELQRELDAEQHQAFVQTLTPFLRDPKKFTGFADEKEYQDFFKKSIEPIYGFDITHMPSVANSMQRDMKSTIDLFEQANTQYSASVVFFYQEYIKEDGSKCIIFTGSQCSCSCNIIRITETCTIIKYGFICTLANFCKFLIWNISRNPNYWRVHQLWSNEVNDFSKKIETLLSTLVWKNVFVKFDPAIEFQGKSDYTDQKIKSIRKEKILTREQMATFLKGTHARLGESSPIQVLYQDILEIISKYVIYL